MRNCVVCGKPTMHTPVRTGIYPAQLTETEIAKQASIPDDTIAKDLWDTEEEIRQLQREIAPRAEFVAFLKLLQAARIQ